MPEQGFEAGAIFSNSESLLLGPLFEGVCV